MGRRVEALRAAVASGDRREEDAQRRVAVMRTL